MKSESNGVRSDVAQVARGMLMGGADIVPGVSGGTIALILGIYERLVTAVSRVDGQFLTHIKQRHWRAAASHIDFRFLVTLGIGVLSGIVVLGSLMHYLLKDGPNIATTCPLTIAAFFGLIVASALHVGRMINNWNLATTFLVIAGALIAYTITGIKSEPTDASLGFLFFCGMIAICAMILPGISGSFIMVLLGVYLTVTGAIKDFIRDVVTVSLSAATWDHFQILAVFACGCLVGILAFSKILRWLLQNFHSPTMAVLCGFMLGSLRELWPFQKSNFKFPALEYHGEHSVMADWLPQSVRNTIPEVWEPTNLLIPSSFSGLVLGCIGTMFAAIAFVLVLEWISTRGAK